MSTPSADLQRVSLMTNAFAQMLALQARKGPRATRKINQLLVFIIQYCGRMQMDQVQQETCNAVGCRYPEPKMLKLDNMSQVLPTELDPESQKLILLEQVMDLPTGHLWLLCFLLLFTKRSFAAGSQ